jgi:hypothetical protein
MNMVLLALDDDLSDRVFNLTFDKNRNSLVHLGANSFADQRACQFVFAHFVAAF